jgi:hypothetical protein
MQSSAAADRQSVTTRGTARGTQVSTTALGHPDPDSSPRPLAIAPLQCLYSNGGYTYLDVRSSLEVDEVGKVKDSVNIPWVICTRVWDAQEQKKVIKKEDNTEFIAQVRTQAAGQQPTAQTVQACMPARQSSRL